MLDEPFGDGKNAEKPYSHSLLLAIEAGVGGRSVKLECLAQGDRFSEPEKGGVVLVKSDLLCGCVSMMA